MYNELKNFFPFWPEVRDNGGWDESSFQKIKLHKFISIQDLMLLLSTSTISSVPTRSYIVVQKRISIHYCPVFPRSRSTAACTFPAVAISARIFSWVSKKPISCNWANWVAYNSSGGTTITHQEENKHRSCQREREKERQTARESNNHWICWVHPIPPSQVHRTCSSAFPFPCCQMLQLLKSSSWYE